MIAVRYDETQIEREGEPAVMPEITVRETYKNPGIRCFRTSARQLIENHFGNRFSFNSYNDVEKRSNGRGVIWNGEYLEGIEVRIFQWDGALKNVYIKYTGNDPVKDLKEIREVFAEAGLEKRVAKKKSP